MSERVSTPEDEADDDAAALSADLADEYEMLEDTVDVLSDLLAALDDLPQGASDTAAIRHLYLVSSRARALLRRPDLQAFQDSRHLPDGFFTHLLGHLVADYIGTTDDPDRYFGPGAPDPETTMAAAVRWGVSEGRLTLEDAERIQAVLQKEPEQS